MTEQTDKENGTGSSGQTEPENGSGSSKIWWIIIAVAAVLVIVVLAFIFFGNQGEPPSEGANATPVPPTVAAPTPLPESASVTANVDINVRSGPGTNYPAYGVAPTGSQAEVIGVSPDSGWWNISVDPANIPAGNAWVSAEYVTAENTGNVPVVQPPSPPPEIAPPTPAPDEPQVTTIDVVNVRSGPGLEYPIYGLAPIGATGKVVGLSEDGGWWAVELPTTISPDGMGWVSADWVIAENTENVPVIPAGELPPPPEVPPPGEGEPQATAIEPINVRSGPGSAYLSYGVVSVGTTGRVIGVSEDDGWWVVALPMDIAPDGMGWVSAAYVVTANTEGVPVIPTPPLE
jgi:uncharacterized protein YraI